MAIPARAKAPMPTTSLAAAPVYLATDGPVVVASTDLPVEAAGVLDGVTVYVLYVQEVTAAGVDQAPHETAELVEALTLLLVVLELEADDQADQAGSVLELLELEVDHSDQVWAGSVDLVVDLVVEADDQSDQV